MSGEPTKLKILKSHSLIGHKAPVVCLEYCDRLDGLYSGSEVLDSINNYYHYTFLHNYLLGRVS